MGYLRIARRAIVLASLALVAACTTTTITPQAAQKPAQHYTIVELGSVEPTDKTWVGEALHFRKGFVDRLRELKAFDTVNDPADGSPPPEAIVVSGAITQVDKGSKVVRWLIGFGAGRARVEGEFQITDAGGTVLAKFGNAKAYSGGYGFGGLDLLDIDDIMEKFGADTADAVVRWSQGKPVDEMRSG
ncbi:MAG TPA: DUF4410 domain-containing protein [Alphaproteobacteria bacterium]|nr:DUF4410 domain-containing protein [Alphaproteobacteria bacterium]